MLATTKPVMMWFVLLISGLVGAFMGSFLNVCIHRLPRNESVVKPGSRCYSCGTHVQWYDNIPILSYLILRGRCRWCGAGFSARYVISELAVAGLTMLAVWWCIQQMDAGRINILSLLTADIFHGVIGQVAFVAAILTLFYYLYVASMIDADHRIIPDELSMGFQFLAIPLACLLPLGCGPQFMLGNHAVPNLALAMERIWFGPSAYYFMLFGLMAVFVLCLPVARWVYTKKVLLHERWRDEDKKSYYIGLWVFLTCMIGYSVVLVIWHALESEPKSDAEANWVFLRWHYMDVLLGAALGWALPYFVGIFGSIAFSRSAMGYGDVKFLAPVGAFVGPIGIIEVFLCAAIVGTVIGLPAHLLNRNLELPFGPYLAIGAVMTLLWGQQIAAWMLPGFFIA